MLLLSVTMENPSTITRLAVLLFLFHQVCGIVIPVPEEMVPENLAVRDPNSESGFSINHDVLSQLLKKVYSSSIVKRPGMIDNQAECRDCGNEEEERQEDSHEARVAANLHQQPDHSNNQVGLRSTEQSSGSAECQSARDEYQTVSGQYPFSEFSPKAYDQSKQLKSPCSKQYFIQDSTLDLQQRYAQQQSTSTVRSGSQSGMHQPAQQYVQQELAQRGSAVAGYRQYSSNSHPSRTPEQSHPSQPPSQHTPSLQIGNVSVRRRSFS